MLDREFKNGEALPFSPQRQQGVLGHLIKDKSFFYQGKDRIRPAWFHDPNVARVWASVLEFYKEFQRQPTIPEIKDWKGFQVEEPKVLKRLQSTVGLCLEQSVNFGIDTIRPDLTEWFHARIYGEATVEAADLYNSRSFKDAYLRMKKAIRQIDNVRFEPDDAIDFNNTYQFLDDSTKEISNAVTFGIDTVDRLLLPSTVEVHNGSLLKGDTTILLAPTNVGKTTTMVTVIRHNLMKKKSILFITHEGRPEDILEKIWCSLMKVTKTDLYNMYKTPEGRLKMDGYLQYVINPYLTYVPMNKAGLTVEEVEAMIRMKQEERIIKTGSGYDMVVCDYPAKLTTAMAKGGNMAKRTIDEYVYNYFVQLALEYKFHCLLAVQSNREGSRVNKRQRGETRLLTMEDVSESFPVMMIATNVISINRDDESEAAGRVTYLICKSRSNEKGFAIVCKSAFAMSLTHSNKFGSAWYRGTSNIDKVDALLTQFQGNEIPYSAIKEAAAAA